MKKHILLSLCFLCIFSFYACSGTKQTEKSIKRTNTEYSGFSDIPDNYTPLEAKEDGCFVIISDGTGDAEPEVYGKNQWQAFFENSKNGKDAFLRVAHFIGNEGYYKDLYYRKDKYYLYSKNEYGIQLEGPFKYLRALTGKDGMPRKEVTLYVLTDSMDLTCEDVLRSFYSSNLTKITKIPFEWLGFTTYLDNAASDSSVSSPPISED